MQNYFKIPRSIYDLGLFDLGGGDGVRRWSHFEALVYYFWHQQEPGTPRIDSHERHREKAVEHFRLKWGWEEERVAEFVCFMRTYDIYVERGRDEELRRCFAPVIKSIYEGG